MNILICEDEPVTARRIVRLALGVEGIDVFGTCFTGAEALAMLDKAPIDVALLDINLPDMSGLVVAERAIETGASVIFITAYDMNAVRAFDIGALDFLVKPVEAVRFEEALARAARNLEERTRAERAAELERMVKQLRQDRYEGKHTYDFWIRNRDQRVRVGVEQVRYMEAARDYIILHAGDRQHMVRKTMSDMEREVDPRVMVRIHRSYFVNVKAVESLQVEDGRLSAVKLASGDMVPVGPAYQNALRLALRTANA